jgi:hypothetical protein
MMKRILLHLTCHGIALALIIAAGITGYIYFAPVGYLFEIILWFYVLSLARKRKQARRIELFGGTGSDGTSNQNERETPSQALEEKLND